LTPSVAAGGSAGFESSDGLKASQPWKNSEGIRQSAVLEGSGGFSLSHEFSPSASFTHKEEAYTHGRSILDLSGYLFFVFFYEGIE
jgi:hypothetical protein